MTTPPVVELIRSPELTDRAPYADAATVRDASRLIFTAGVCPLDGGGAIVAVGDVTRQTEQVMANLATALEAAGVGLTDVVKTTVYVAVRHPRRPQYAARGRRPGLPRPTCRSRGSRSCPLTVPLAVRMLGLERWRDV